jgi:acetyl-CoA carboxylase biotin carboxyl carrier protein
VDIKEIRALIDLMKKNGLAVFKMEKEGFKITLEMAGANAQPVIQYAAAPAALPAAPAAAPAPAAAAASAPAESASNLKEIASPMVGTFYSSPSPDAPAYVTVGQTVTPDTVVCIIEAMKVMNEIKAEVAGVVAEIVAENGKPVQFGQALFRVK